MSEYIVKCKEVEGISGKTLLVPDYIDLNSEIIRCRDCTHFTYANKKHSGHDWCDFHYHIGWSVNGFCMWGERKEGNV